MSEAVFFALLKRAKLPRPVPEYVFAKPRKWRFDYAWPAERIALEVEGGVWSRGRHVRPSGYLKDLEKYNRAACLGWRLLRVTPSQLATLETIDMIRDALTATEAA